MAASIAEAYYGIPENLVIKTNEHLSIDLKKILIEFDNVRNELMKKKNK